MDATASSHLRQRMQPHHVLARAQGRARVHRRAPPRRLLLAHLRLLLRHAATMARTVTIRTEWATLVISIGAKSAGGCGAAQLCGGRNPADPTYHLRRLTFRRHLRGTRIERWTSISLCPSRNSGVDSFLLVLLSFFTLFLKLMLLLFAVESVVFLLLLFCFRLFQSALRHLVYDLQTTNQKFKSNVFRCLYDTHVAHLTRTRTV